MLKNSLNCNLLHCQQFSKCSWHLTETFLNKIFFFHLSMFNLNIIYGNEKNHRFLTTYSNMIPLLYNLLHWNRRLTFMFFCLDISISQSQDYCLFGKYLCFWKFLFSVLLWKYTLQIILYSLSILNEIHNVNKGSIIK